MTRLSALAIAGATLVLASGAASAQPAARRLAVVAIWAPPNLVGIGSKLTQDVQAVAETEGYQVLAPSEVERVLGSAAYKSLQDCQGKSACVAAHSTGLAADQLVAGVLERNETSYLVRLYLIELASSTVVASIDRSILIASRRLHQDVHEALPRFLKGEQEAKGRITIETSARSASVIFDGQPVGTTPFTLETKPGKHSLRIEKESYLPIERFVTVEANGEEKISLLMTPVPGTHPEEEPAAGVQQHSDAGGFSLPSSSWIAGGTALAAAGVGAFFAMRSSELEGRAGTESPYQITRNEAFQGRDDARIANICFGVAGAAALTSVVLAFVMPDEPAQPALAPAVAPTPGGAALSLNGSF